MDNSKNRPNEYLGVNKTGKSIRKNFVNSGGGSNVNPPRQQPPQPHVYNISKNDFRSIVQQLTGSPSRHDPLPRPPPNNPPKNPSMRLQRIRPPPLTPINRPPVPHVVAMQPPPQGPPMVPPNPMAVYSNNNFGMQPPQFGQPSPRRLHPLVRGDSGWRNPALSPISAYVQQLQSCIGDGGPGSAQSTLQPQPGQLRAQTQMQPHTPGQPLMQSRFPGHGYGQPRSSGLLPTPSMPPLPSPRTNGPALLPSPTSQFLLPSPSGFLNLSSPTPTTPYPLLSPRSQFPPPLSPNFAFSPFGQSGILGPGPQLPFSPGSLFSLSPSGFFPALSPRWRA